MTLLVEDGSGVRDANAYSDVQFVIDYLTERNRGTNYLAAPLAEQEAAVISGTDYLENKYALILRGSRQYRDISTARNTLTFLVQPLPGDTVDVGADTYTFVSTVPAVAYEVFIDPMILAETINNFLRALNGDTSVDGLVGPGTEANQQAYGAVLLDYSSVVYSRILGPSGNEVQVATDVIGATWDYGPTLVGGSNIVIPQTLSFPRENLFTRDGVPVVGVPWNVQATGAEYAERSIDGTLAPDPVTDPLGGSVTRIRRETGPLKREVEYVDGSTSTGSLPSYPTADRLMSEYLTTGGGVVRG